MPVFFSDNFSLFALLAAALQLALVLGVIIRVTLTRHPPGSSFAWILITLSVPYIGFFLYLLLGEQSLGRWHSFKLRKAVRRYRQNYRKRIQPTIRLAPAVYAGIYRLAARLGKYPLTEHSSLHLLGDSNKTIDRILRDINLATHSLFFEFYIWDIGGRADEICQAVINASRRGVRCYILVDAIGSLNFLNSHWKDRLQEAGVVVEKALPVSVFGAFFARADIRLHRKIIIIDHAIAYTGSLNVIDPIFFKAKEHVGEWFDAMVRAKGEIVESLYGLFVFDWTVNADSQTQLPAFEHNNNQIDQRDKATVMLVPSGPGTTQNANQRLLLDAIHCAKKQIQIVTPYFIPSEALVLALQNACAKGIRVELIVPMKSDSKLVSYASYRYFDDLLQSGAKIYLFKNGVLHTKSLLIDHELAFFGTMNLDARSMHLNYELMLLVSNSVFSARLEALHESYKQQSDKLILSQWFHRPFLERIKEGMSHLVSPLL